jgi:tetratricopeptide (TPR) repeat protein
MKLTIGAVLLAAVLAGCVMLSPPEGEPEGGTAGYPTQGQQGARPAGPAGAATAASPAPFATEPPAQAQPPAGPQQRQFALGPAATALIDEAHAQEQSRNFAIAGQTLERALGIEPHNPLVWIELGRENILAGNPAQAYGMGRKALYLATADPRAQASAWELIAAALRAQGRNDEAYVAEEKAASLSPQ